MKLIPLFVYFICTSKLNFGLKCHESSRIDTKRPKDWFWNSNDWNKEDRSYIFDRNCSYCLRQNADFQNENGVRFKMVDQNCRWSIEEIKPMCLDLYEFSDKTIAVRSTKIHKHSGQPTLCLVVWPKCI